MKSLSFFLLSLMLLTGCASNSVKPQADATAKAPESQLAQASDAASGEQQASTGNSAPAEHSVYFNFDQSDIQDAYKPTLEANAKYLKEHVNTKIVLEGNTDERGSSEYNLALGNRRAESTKKVLSILGVPAKNIQVVSFGKEKPKADCHEESCWSENRRADIIYNNVN